MGCGFLSESAKVVHVLSCEVVYESAWICNFLSPSLHAHSTAYFSSPDYNNCTSCDIKDSFHAFFYWVQFAKYIRKDTVRHITYDLWGFEYSVSACMANHVVCVSLPPVDFELTSSFSFSFQVSCNCLSPCIGSGDKRIIPAVGEARWRQPSCLLQL